MHLRVNMQAISELDIFDFRSYGKITCYIATCYFVPNWVNDSPTIKGNFEGSFCKCNVADIKCKLVNGNSTKYKKTTFYMLQKRYTMHLKVNNSFKI